MTTCESEVKPLLSSQSALQSAFAERDFHIHTFFSPCCHEETDTVENVVRTAEKRGLKQIAFTDHWHQSRGGYRPPKFYEPVGEEVYRQTREQLAQINTSIEVLVSCEVDMARPGVFTVSEELTGELDYVLVTASHFHMPDVAQPRSHSLRDLAEHGLTMLRAAVAWPPAQVIAHPVCRFWAKERALAEVVGAVADDEFLAVLDTAASRNVALEMNCGSFGLSPEEDEAQVRFYRLAKAAGCKVAPGSDSHTLAGIGDTGRLAGYAAQAGLTREDVVDAAWFRAR